MKLVPIASELDIASKRPMYLSSTIVGSSDGQLMRLLVVGVVVEVWFLESWRCSRCLYTWRRLSNRCHCRDILTELLFVDCDVHYNRLECSTNFQRY